MVGIKSKKTIALLLKLCISILVVAISFASNNALAITVDSFLEQSNISGMKFEKRKINEKTVYFHERKINGAIIENGLIVYKFNSSTDELVGKKDFLRSKMTHQVMPFTASSLISQEEAESMVQGNIMYSRLYIIAPDSYVFPIDPLPTNPCWVVTSNQNGIITVTIIDGVTGKYLGDGVPPPQAFTFSGPVRGLQCSGAWTSWYTNAQKWFDKMGYPTEAVKWPTRETMIEHIQSHKTAMFYEIAHGGSYIFEGGCTSSGTVDTLSSFAVKKVIPDYPKMPFTFLASCDGMCETDEYSFSYEFRKGSDQDTATVGYCGMSSGPCSSCWNYSVGWQDALFSYMSQGHTVKEAYDKAMEDYPVCMTDTGGCMRFAGDEEFAVVPVINRNGEPVDDDDNDDSDDGGDSDGNKPLSNRLSLKVKIPRGAPKFERVSPVSLVDEVEDKDFEVMKPFELYSLTDVDDTARPDSDTYLVSYLIKEVKKSCSDDAPQNPLRSCDKEEDCGGITRQTKHCQRTPKHERQTYIKVKNQLGEVTVDTLKADLLLVPIAMSLNAPVDPLNPVESNHYKCYRVGVSKGTDKFERQTVTLLDQCIENQSGEPKVFEVKKPERLCMPVKMTVKDTDNEVIDSAENLMCYTVRPIRGEEKHQKIGGVNINNSFGPLQLETNSEDQLCVVSDVTF